jgi:hypothetical protein
MPLAQRLAAALSANNIVAVKDLLRFEIGSLLRIPRFGEKSIGGLAAMLLKALEEGPRQTDRGSAGPLDRSLSALTGRERDVVCRRLGHNRARQTRKEIAGEYGVTEERVRQIEKKAGGKLGLDIAVQCRS